jgi:hypothetical protein
MPNTIEDFLVRIHDNPELDEHTKLVRLLRRLKPSSMRHRKR